jgi:Aspartyl protease
MPVAYTYLPWQTTTSTEEYKEERFEIIDTNKPPILGAGFLNKTGIWPPRGPNRDGFETQAENVSAGLGLGMTEVRQWLKPVLPIVVNGQTRVAVIDIGCDENWISASLVRDLGLNIKGERQSFQTAIGKRVNSLGTVNFSFEFSSSSAPHTTEFSVLDTLKDDVILGDRSLREIGALTHNRHLLKVIDSRDEDKYVPGQNYIIPCYLNGKYDVAVLDPGHFGGNVIALSHASKYKYPIDTSRRPELELGGGQTTLKSDGVVTIDAFRLGDLSGVATTVEFTVVKGWTEDITIGNHTIMSTYALSGQYEAYRERHEPEIAGPVFGSGYQFDGAQRQLLRALNNATDVLRRATLQLTSARGWLATVRDRLERIDGRFGMYGVTRRERQRLERQREREAREVRDAELAIERAAAEEIRATEELQDLRDNLVNAGIDQ